MTEGSLKTSSFTGTNGKLGTEYTNFLQHDTYIKRDKKHKKPFRMVQPGIPW